MADKIEPMDTTFLDEVQKYTQQMQNRKPLKKLPKPQAPSKNDDSDYASPATTRGMSKSAMQDYRSGQKRKL